MSGSWMIEKIHLSCEYRNIFIIISIRKIKTRNFSGKWGSEEKFLFSLKHSEVLKFLIMRI